MAGFITSDSIDSLSGMGYGNDMAQFAALAIYPLQGIVMPTLIVHGTADVDIPFSQAREMVHALPHAQLVAIDGAQHLSTLTNEKAMTAIHCFLQKTQSTEEGPLAG